MATLVTKLVPVMWKDSTRQLEIYRNESVWVFLHLWEGKNTKFQYEAMSIIPNSFENYLCISHFLQMTDLTLPILEELFFKNLITAFPPHHPVYDKILEQTFLNHDLDEVKQHIRVLIDRLIEQKHLPYAVALLNQLETIPPALATFETCFELLLRKK